MSDLLTRRTAVLLTLVFLTLVTALLPASAFSQASPAGGTSIKPYLGRWDLTLRTADREYPSWLEITGNDGKLAARFVGRWGHARALPRIELADGKLIFVSPKEEEGTKTDLVFEGKLVGDTLTGTGNAPDGGTWSWTGKRAPALARKEVAGWGKPISLFNGKDLTGWKMNKPSDKAWTVVGGTLVSPGNGPEIITEQQFEDFKLHVEFNCPENSNSGVYLRGRYEVQVETNSAQEPANRRMGAVYGSIAPSPEQPRKPGEWQTYDITLLGRTITVVQNGVTTIDRQELPGITGGALDSHEELPGPIYLQGSEDGHISYRNIVITPAKKP